VKHKQTFNFPPKVKQRPRMTRRGRVFTPAQTLEFEALVREAWTGELIEGNITVNIVFYKDKFEVTVESTEAYEPTKLRGDIDNYVKAVLDGLNGIAFIDDKFIRKMTVVKK
jgi:crossover junction endodeoxyribonuclease RusA